MCVHKHQKPTILEGENQKQSFVRKKSSAQKKSNGCSFQIMMRHLDKKYSLHSVHTFCTILLMF